MERQYCCVECLMTAGIDLNSDAMASLAYLPQTRQQGKLCARQNPCSEYVGG